MVMKRFYTIILIGLVLGCNPNSGSLFLSNYYDDLSINITLNDDLVFESWLPFSDIPGQLLEQEINPVCRDSLRLSVSIFVDNEIYTKDSVIDCKLKYIYITIKDKIIIEHDPLFEQGFEKYSYPEIGVIGSEKEIFHDM